MSLCVHHDISFVQYEYVDLLEVDHLETCAPVQQRAWRADHNVVHQPLTPRNCKETRPTSSRSTFSSSKYIKGQTFYISKTSRTKRFIPEYKDNSDRTTSTVKQNYDNTSAFCSERSRTRNVFLPARHNDHQQH